MLKKTKTRPGTQFWESGFIRSVLSGSIFPSICLLVLYFQEAGVREEGEGLGSFSLFLFVFLKEKKNKNWWDLRVFRLWIELGTLLGLEESITMNMMRRLKSIASGRTSISSDPVSLTSLIYFPNQNFNFWTKFHFFFHLVVGKMDTPTLIMEWTCSLF